MKHNEQGNGTQRDPHQGAVPGQQPAPIKIGIAGLGRAGWGMHCAELAGREALFQVVAACDVLADRRQRMVDRYGCRAYADFGALIHDPDVELIDIATRTADHYDHAVAALRAGKHVQLEKPICMTHEQAVSLQAVAAGSKGRLFVRHNRRFDPDFLDVQEIINSGLLGEVFEIRLARHGYSRRDDWQTIKEHGGGQLLNWGPHIVDHALRFLGGTYETMFSDLKRVAAVGDAEDHLKIVLRGKTGLLVDLEISGGVAIGAPTYQVFGTTGSIEVRSGTMTLRYLDPAQPVAAKQANPGTPGDTFGSVEKLPWIEQTRPVRSGDNYIIWQHVFDAVRNGKPYPILMEEAVAVMEVISRAKRNTAF